MIEQLTRIANSLETIAKNSEYQKQQTMIMEPFIHAFADIAQDLLPVYKQAMDMILAELQEV